MSLKIIFRTAALALIVLAHPSGAQPFDPMADATPAEQILLPELAGIMGEHTGAETARILLPRVEALLAKLPSPTPFRGYVQFVRAEMLVQTTPDDLAINAAARAAAEEAIRLLPNDARPKMLATYIYTFGGNAGRAADLWLGLSRDDPTMAADSDVYMIGALLGRLNDEGDRRRVDLVSQRLVDIGFKNADPLDQSSLIMTSLKAKWRAGDRAGAEALVPSLLHPEQHAALLIDKEYQPLWPAIERWAGPRLERQWPAYLNEMKRNWEASQSLRAGTPYADALSEARDHAALVSTFLPILGQPLPPGEEFDAITLAPIVAHAMAQTGQLDAAIAMLGRMVKTLPEADPNRMNYTANIAAMTLEYGQPADALRLIDPVIAAADRVGPGVNFSAKVAMHSVRACALHRLGREAEAVTSITLIAGARRNIPGPYMSLMTCLQRPDEALTFLLSLLADPDRRAFTLGFIQPTIPLPVVTPNAIRERSFGDALRSSPQLLKAAARYGRVLGFAINAAAVAPPSQ